MEPAKLQASKLFTHSPIDFRDKIEEVAEIFLFFSSIFSPAIFSCEKRDVLKSASKLIFAPTACVIAEVRERLSEPSKLNQWTNRQGTHRCYQVDGVDGHQTARRSAIRICLPHANRHTAGSCCSKRPFDSDSRRTRIHRQSPHRNHQRQVSEISGDRQAPTSLVLQGTPEIARIESENQFPVVGAASASLWRRRHAQEHCVDRRNSRHFD